MLLASYLARQASQSKQCTCHGRSFDEFGGVLPMAGLEKLWTAVLADCPWQAPLVALWRA